MQDKKIIKSFKKLSEINRRELYNKSGKLKKLNKKYAVSIARQLASGFDNIDLRKEPSKSEYKRAQKYIKEFYSQARSEKTKIIRPRKQNRKLYASFSNMSGNFKIYAVPVIDEKDTFKIIKKGKKKKLKRIGEFSKTESFEFKDYGISKKEIVTDTKKATNKLFNEIEKDYDNETYAVKIKCGAHEYSALYQDKTPYIEIEQWINIYGAEKVKKFCLGFNVYTFKNQEPISKMAMKGDKKKKFKNLKNIGKENIKFKNCKTCKTKTKCKKEKQCLKKIK